MPADVEKEEVGDDDEQRAPAMTVSSDIDRMVSVNFLFTTLICLLL